MLLSIISSSAVSMITSPGLPQFGGTVVVGLVILLSLKEIFSASEQWDKHLNASFNMTILPLMVAFVGIVIFKVVSII
ncbi:MAG: hypothetical protein WB014_07965 [Methanosarcina sp.]